MLFLKNLGKALLYSNIGLFGLTLIMTLLNYINIINISIVNIFSYIIPFISLFIGGIIMGKNSQKKGWLEGLKFGLIVTIILFMLNFLGFDQGYTKDNIILYIIVMIASILGGMMGINFKKID